MKNILIALAVFNLTGCGVLGYVYDSADKCQHTELLKTGEYPSYCGAGAGSNRGRGPVIVSGYTKANGSSRGVKCLGYRNDNAGYSCAYR